MYVRLADPLPLMAHKAVAVLMLGLLVACGPAASDKAGKLAPAIQEPEAETLYAIPPNGWTLESSSNRGNFRRARYLRNPDAEVVESLTLESYPATDQPDPLTFLDALAVDEADRCDGFRREPTFAGEERGRPVAVELHRCPRRPVNGQAVVSLIKVIQGTEIYAVITLAMQARAKSSAEGWVVDFVEEGDVARWAIYLKNVYLTGGKAEADTQRSNGGDAT